MVVDSAPPLLNGVYLSWTAFSADSLVIHQGMHIRHSSFAVNSSCQAQLCVLALQAEESAAAAEQRLQELTAQIGAMQHEMHRQQFAASSARQLQAQLEEVCGMSVCTFAMCKQSGYHAL